MHKQDFTLSAGFLTVVVTLQAERSWKEIDLHINKLNSIYPKVVFV